MNSVIITGATSLVGAATIDECIKNNVWVTALVRKSSSKLDHIPDSPLVHVIECDLEELSDIKNDVKGDVFYHFGWSNTSKTGRMDSVLQAENIGFSINALHLAKRIGCKKFIGAGSQAEYGIHVSKQTSPDSPLYPQEAYGAAKASAGWLCKFEAEKLDIDFAWVRIFSLIGKYEHESTLIQTTLKKMINNEKCSFSPCTHSWDYLYSADAGKAFYLLGEKFSGIKFYCLGSGKSRPLCEYITEIKEILGSKSELGFGDIPYPHMPPTGFCADISELTKDTGWMPETEFKDGIREMLDFQKMETGGGKHDYFLIIIVFSSGIFKGGERNA